MAELFSGREAIAEACFIPNISDAEPSSTVKRRRPKRGSNAERPTEMNQKSLLFKLPVEIRLEIYDLLLVSRFNGSDTPSWAAGRQKLIMLQLDYIPDRDNRTMDPAVLQTCKQIYLETVPILYARNIFHLDDPVLMLRLVAQIGPTNTKLIQSLVIFVPPNPDNNLWLKLLHVLSEAATGLKTVDVEWWGEGRDRPGKVSLGKDIAFAQALAGLSKVGVVKLRIKGYYAKAWPAYFRDKFGAGVVEVEEDRLKDDGVDWRRKLNEEYLENLRKFQEGTEGLNPWEDEAGDATLR